MEPEPSVLKGSENRNDFEPSSQPPLNLVQIKASPLKHVNPIIKKYDCQRQAKNGKSSKIKTHPKPQDEESNIPHSTTVQDLVAGMDSLDAALRKAEMCIAGGKDNDSPHELPGDHGLENAIDDLGDAEEEGTQTAIGVSSQQNPTSNRTSHPRNRNRVLKKRNQLQKDLEHALPLAESDEPLISEERSHGYAASFFLKVKQRYEHQDPSVFSKFLELMQEFGASFTNITDLYHRIINLFGEGSDLCEEFLLFLRPHEALHCGKYMEHLALTEMSSFLRKVEVSFAKQPQHFKKLQASWARLAETPDVTLEMVLNATLPLLKGNQLLVDSFRELLPSDKPPENKMTDFDHIDLESEHSGDDEIFEKFEIPPERNDPFGGEHCQCCCHSTSSDPALLNRSKHCSPCGIKFIAGKIFMQTEHGLKPVKVDFSGGGSTINNLKRLNVDHQKLSRPRSRRGRQSAVQASSRTEECKQSVETDEEHPFSSRVKSPRQRSKVPKSIREKPTSSRSLSTNKPGCPRKQCGNNFSPPLLPVIHDQEALAPPSLNEEDKPSTLDFSNLSNVLNKDQFRNVQRGQSSVNIVEGSSSLIESELNEERKADIDNCDGPVSGSSTLITNNPSKSPKEETRYASSNDKIVLEDVAMGDATGHFVNPVVRDLNDSTARGSGTSSECYTEKSLDEVLWTREEDRIILCTFQSEPDREKTLTKISAQLPHRTIEEISCRFQLLVNLIKQMSK